MAENPRIEELRKRLEKEPGSRMFAQLAEELRKEGEFEEAIRVSREGLQKHANYPSARMTLGRALMDTGDLAAAKGEFEAVLKGAPDNILASRYLGECLEGLGDIEGARARYKTTLMLAPGDKQVAARLEGLQAAKVAPASQVVAPPATARAPEPEPEPAPIPLAQVDEESFELETPYNAPKQAPAVAATALPPPIPAPALVPVIEPAPIPLVAAEESFELERPYDAPAAAHASPPVPPAALPPPALEPETPADLDFDAAPVSTLPFRAAEDYAAAGWDAGGAPAPAAAPEAAPATEIASPTLAELYFNQGFTDKAIEVYRQILQREPGNQRAQARIMELEALERHLRAEEARSAPAPARAAPAPAPAPASAAVSTPTPAGAAPVAAADSRAARRQAIQQTIARLEGLLVAMRRG